MNSNQDRHVRVLPLHVANKIAAGEVVERPASVVKELIENSIDANAQRIDVTISKGGRKLIAVQDDGCGMGKDDAILSLERQATSKIHDVSDIDAISTLGFRGEAIPSIASVSRFTLTTRQHDCDDGTLLQVNAGTLAEVRSAGCPPGTLVEVRDLFCNVPARQKFLRAAATEENHIRQIFITQALAHPSIGFSLTIDSRELYKFAPTKNLKDRIRDIFGNEFVENMLPISCTGATEETSSNIRVTGYIEKPNLSTPTRHEQYVFINGRPASAPSILYALREAYPRQVGETRPATILFIQLPPNQVDVNVHPTKREVRFRNNAAIKNAILSAIGQTLQAGKVHTVQSSPLPRPPTPIHSEPQPQVSVTLETPPAQSTPIQEPQPLPLEFALEPDASSVKPWQWFKYLAQSSSGYLLIETDSGLVTINPHAAQERIVYEKMIDASNAPQKPQTTQALLIPETAHLSPIEAARIEQSLTIIRSMGFQIEPFGRDTFKIDAVPQLIGSHSPQAVLTTIANDLAEGHSKRSGNQWRAELIAKSIARSLSGASSALTEKGAIQLVEDLCSCRMPYICPRGKPVMIFTSTRELNRKFDRQ